MKTLIALGVAATGGVIAFRYLPRHQLTDLAKRRMIAGMEHMMESLPENAPPKLIMSLLPKLQEQNEQIIAMLREQNDLLRQQERAAAARAGT